MRRENIDRQVEQRDMEQREARCRPSTSTSSIDFDPVQWFDKVSLGEEKKTEKKNSLAPDQTKK